MSETTVAQKAAVETKTAIGAEEARKVIQQDLEQRIAACQAEVLAVLKKYNCQLHPQLVTTPQGQHFSWHFVPAPQDK